MKTIMMSVNSLIPYKLNAKLHPKEQIDKLADWITRAGFIQPVVIDANNEIIIGHGRTIAAKQAGLDKVPCVRVDGLNEAEIRSLRLFDNKVADTGFDESLLKQEAMELANLDEFTIDLTGFDEPDFVKNLDKEHPMRLDFDSKQEAEQEKADTVPETAQNQFGVKRGQIWQLGEHRLMCGDSAEESDVSRLMAGKLADMVFTDPPYGVSYVGKTKEALTIESDDFDENKLTAINRKWFNCVDLAIRPGAYVLATVPARPLHLIFAFDWKDRGWLRQIMVWNKSSMVLGHSEYHYKHEPILFGWKPGGGRLANSDRTKTTVWDFSKPSRSAEHPTMKPVEMWEYGISNHSVKGSILYEPFSGSGTCIIACEKTDRICYGMEIDPHYCSVIINRWQEFTGKTAQLITGASNV